MMMRRLVAALMLTGIAAGGMWACGSDSYSDGPAGTIDVTELVSGYMRLNANGTYLRSHTYRTTRYTSRLMSRPTVARGPFQHGTR
jgi:hypothetical protein